MKLAGTVDAYLIAMASAEFTSSVGRQPSGRIVVLGLGAILLAASCGGSSGLPHDTAADEGQKTADTSAGLDAGTDGDGVAPRDAIGDAVVHDSPADQADRSAHADGATTDGGAGAFCWSESDCHPPPFLFCRAPGEALGCPICNAPPNPCTSDQQCGATNPIAICEPVSCNCHGERMCFPGCTSDAQCLADSACGADHRCAPRPCTAATVCPKDFSCAPGLGCQRISCVRDDQCSGACVKGRCYDAPGTCTPPPQ